MNYRQKNLITKPMMYHKTRVGLTSGSLIFFFLLLLEASPLLGQLSLPEVFSDHMVLQREEPIPIWGSGAETGQSVTVEFENSSRKTLADNTGSWNVKFPSMSAVVAGYLGTQRADYYARYRNNVY
jgi:sialate O-acetylesterase